MRLFHGSTLAILAPRITNRRKTLDFGTGFYLSSNESQAQEFAAKAFQRRGREGVPTVSVFEFDLAEARRTLSVLEFCSPNEEWLDFVVHGSNELSLILGTAIVPAILEDLGIEDEKGIQDFYRSDLYELLRQPETSLWHLSPATLAEMYEEELRMGNCEMPEEQS